MIFSAITYSIFARHAGESRHLVELRVCIPGFRRDDGGLLFSLPNLMMGWKVPSGFPDLSRE